jgi:hypothetical protein
VQALVSPTLTAAWQLVQAQPMAAARQPAQALPLVAAAVAAPQRS